MCLRTLPNQSSRSLTGGHKPSFVPRRFIIPVINLEIKWWGSCLRVRRDDDCPTVSAAINTLQNQGVSQRSFWRLTYDSLPCGRTGCPAYRVGCVFAVEGRFSLAYSYHRWVPWVKQETSLTHKTDTSQSRCEPSQLIIHIAIDNVKVSVLLLSVPSIREGYLCLVRKSYDN